MGSHGQVMLSLKDSHTCHLRVCPFSPFVDFTCILSALHHSTQNRERTSLFLMLCLLKPQLRPRKPSVVCVSLSSLFLSWRKKFWVKSLSEAGRDSNSTEADFLCCLIPLTTGNGCQYSATGTWLKAFKIYSCGSLK